MLRKPKVFIHTNDQQLVGALVAAFSMKRAAHTPETFDIQLVRLEETPHLTKREGQPYLRKGRRAVWCNRDLQSFSPLRRMIPQLMGFRGRAVVTDPDVFAVGDINRLLTMDMKGKAILCRYIAGGYRNSGSAFFASSVMLLECSKLEHWNWDRDIEEIFAGRLDYGPWIGLLTEDPATIGEIGEEWNSFDKLEADTQLLHMTERSTQPWKTGLPVDFDLNIGSKGRVGWTSIIERFRTIIGARPPRSSKPKRYQPHPDPRQERFFFELLRDALEAGAVEESLIHERMAADDIRHDAGQILAELGYRSRLEGFNRDKTVAA